MERHLPERLVIFFAGICLTTAIQASAEEIEDNGESLLNGFFAERYFTLYERQDQLPPAIQYLLGRRPNGDFPSAERDEEWHRTDSIHDENMKFSQHVVSGVSTRFFGSVHLAGGIAVTTRLNVVDLLTEDRVTCRVDDNMREWDGTNHLAEFIQTGEGGVKLCSSLTGEAAARYLKMH